MTRIRRLIKHPLHSLLYEIWRAICGIADKPGVLMAFLVGFLAGVGLVFGIILVLGRLLGMLLGLRQAVLKPAVP